MQQESFSTVVVHSELSAFRRGSGLVAVAESCALLSPDAELGGWMDCFVPCVCSCRQPRMRGGGAACNIESGASVSCFV